MDAARIAALLDPFLDRPLPAPALEQISIYIDLLLRWNARINLTAVRHPDEIVTRHFGESFFLARHLFPASSKPCHPERSQAKSEANGLAKSKDPYSASPSAPPQGVLTVPSQAPQVLDLGSGAGFPALPLKIWSPNIHLTLVESNHKKATFLREAVRSLTLMDVNVIAERAEILLGLSPPQADIVTLRAVERFDAALPLAVKFLAPAARIALLIVASQLPSLPKLAPTIDWLQPISIPQSHSKVLAIGVHTA
ncbi:MAG TPA: 16S rRNA (guanine(527)-N(7))-methyltransferase RsmG [Terriglobales bacterium]|nr:16S rRNA (guanine(527)-N(7))-methyltransferase RsmG [Terriglobales bacterium]